MPRIKPRVPILQRGNPMALSLWHCLAYAEGAGTPRDLAAPSASQPSLASSPTWVASQHGPGLRCTDVAGVDVPDQGNLAAGNLTIRMVFQPRAFGGAYTHQFSKGGAGGELSLYVNVSGNIQYVNIGGGTFEPNTATGMTAGTGRVYDLVLTRTGSTCRVYLDGVAKGSTFTVSGTTASSTSPLRIGFGGNNTNPDNDYILFQAWKGRSLSASEVRQLAADPYALITPARSPIAYSLPTAGGGPTFKPGWIARSPTLGTGVF